MKTTSGSTTSSTNKRGARQQDALALLKDDHQTVQKLFKEFEKIQEKGSPEEKLDLVLQACAELKIHTTIEEKVFYPALREALDEDLLLDEAEIEHRTAKDLIKRLEGMKSDDAQFDATFTVLCEYINHHVEEEESEMFPKAKKAAVDLTELGDRMREMKEQMEGAAGTRGDGASGKGSRSH